MSIGIATFITFRQADYATVVARYQNYWPGQTVDGHLFYPFAAGAIASTSAGGQDSLGISFALSGQILSRIKQGLAQNQTVEVTFYSFTPTASGSPPSSKAIITTFVGEIINAQESEAAISIQVGSSLSAVESQVPPRKFTTTLTGQPPKL